MNLHPWQLSKIATCVDCLVDGILNMTLITPKVKSMVESARCNADDLQTIKSLKRFTNMVYVLNK
jgi:hypothetical protein